MSGPRLNSRKNGTAPSLALCLFAFFGVAPFCRANPAIALPNMAMLTPFAVSGGNLNFSSVTVSGGVTVVNSGVLAIAAASSVYGDVHLGKSAKLTTGSAGRVLPPGQIYQNEDRLYTDLYAVSSALSSLDPFMPYSNWTTSRTIAGNGGLNILNVTGKVSLKNKSVTLIGGPDDIFVINVFGDFDLDGTGGILAGAGMDPSRIIINIVGTGTSMVTSKSGNLIEGTMLLPHRSATLHSINGALYAGAEAVTLTSGASVEYAPFQGQALYQETPEPAAGFLLGAGLLAVAATAKRKLRPFRLHS